MTLGIQMPDEQQLPAGPLRDLVAALHELYRQAGKPGTRLISKKVNERDEFPDTISHEGVSALLRGAGTPRWKKLESLVRVLAGDAIGRPDVEAEVRRFHALWLAVSDVERDGKNGALTTVGLPTFWPLEVNVEGNGGLQTTVFDLKDGRTLVVINGVIDLLRCKELEETLDGLRRRAVPALHQILDLREVPFMDSTGVGLLIKHKKWVHQARGSLTILCSRTVFGILHTLGLHVMLGAVEGDGDTSMAEEMA